MIKRLLSFAILLLLGVSLMSPARAVVAQSKDYYVADYAGVLSDTLKQNIIHSNSDPNGLEQKCQGAQIVVVTVDYLDGMKADEYALQLFNDWGVGGHGGANNGMLLLLATGEKKAWLEIGAGIVNVFTEKTAGDYFDRYFWNAFDKGRYETAVSNMLNALFSWYANYYHVNGMADGGFINGINGGRQPYVDGYGGGYSVAGSLFIWLLIISIIIIVLILAIFSDRRRHRAYYTYLGQPIPPYYPWFIWFGPHRHWWGPGGPGGPGGFGGGRGGGFGGFGGFGGGGGGFGGFGGGGGGFGGGGAGRR